MDWKEYLKPNMEKLKYFLAFTIPIILIFVCVHYFIYHSILNLVGDMLGGTSSLIWLWFAYPAIVFMCYIASCKAYRDKIKIEKGEMHKPTPRERIKTFLFVIICLAIFTILNFYCKIGLWGMIIVALIFIVLSYILKDKLGLYG